MDDEKKTGEGIKASTVSFTPEQLDLVQKMIEASKSSDNTRGVISRYTDVRDSKSVDNVNVSRFDGKFVIGFKDLNTDPYKKAARYSESKFDIKRKLNDQPFVTLLLSTGDDAKTEEKEVSLVEYMDNREKVECKVSSIKESVIIDDKGLLGRQSAGGISAGSVDDDGNFLKPVSVRAEVKRIERVIMVEVPGFKKPVKFIEAFLA